MPNFLSATRTASILALLASLYSGAACAALGALPSWWDAPSDMRKGPSYLYLDRITILPSRTTLHEYIGIDGIVFAVSWNGPTLPDFKALLGGSYAAVMEAEVRSAPVAGRGGIAISTPEFALQSGGRARAFSGKAWIPNRLPAGFAPAVMP
jgi:hypothetical protein